MITTEHYMKQYQARIEDKLKYLLPISESKLHQAMSYSVLNGGKRFRPVLIYTTAEALEINLDKVDALACAIELIHCYSLIHDDLPAMDNDDLRRGKPTCHKAFDEAIAILAGDALQTLAFEIITEANLLSSQQRLDAVKNLAQAIGHQGMAYGQMLDIESNKFIDATQLEAIHRNKTGELIKACIIMALIAGELMQHENSLALIEYGECLGLAFQIQDDILDVEGTIDNLGKLPGVDNQLEKATYPAIIGMNAAKEKLQALHQRMMQLLKSCGLENTYLAELARFIVTRNK